MLGTRSLLAIQGAAALAADREDEVKSRETEMPIRHNALLSSDPNHAQYQISNGLRNLSMRKLGQLNYAQD